MNNLEAGDYVLATKYNDGDFHDHWCVGYFDCVIKQVSTRYMVVDHNGNQFRGNGFRRCEKISQACGERLLLLANEIELAKSLWWFKEHYESNPSRR